MEFSVLLSVYYKENPINLREAIESIYFSQTVKPNEIILVEDGKLTNELYDTIKDLKKKIEILKTIPLEKNVGLGNALKIGVENCKYEIIARMDTDDISSPERFEKQIKYLKENKDVDALGSYMTEFSGDINNVICIKDAPDDKVDMKKYIKYRSPLNHPSVVFKKSKVLEAGNYKEIHLNEDVYLWARMLCKNFKLKNIAEPLVYFRVDENTYKRRGGLKRLKTDFLILKELNKLEIINKRELLINIMIRTFFRLIPNFLRTKLFSKILRKKNKK